MVDGSMWDQMEQWIKLQTKPFKKVEVIGSGGNINSIFKNSGKKTGMPLSYFYLVLLFRIGKIVFE